MHRRWVVVFERGYTNERAYFETYQVAVAFKDTCFPSATIHELPPHPINHLAEAGARKYGIVAVGFGYTNQKNVRCGAYVVCGKREGLLNVKPSPIDVGLSEEKFKEAFFSFCDGEMIAAKRAIGSLEGHLRSGDTIELELTEEVRNSLVRRSTVGELDPTEITDACLQKLLDIIDKIADRGIIVIRRCLMPEARVMYIGAIQDAAHSNDMDTVCDAVPQT